MAFWLFWTGYWFHIWRKHPIQSTVTSACPTAVQKQEKQGKSSCGRLSSELEPSPGCPLSGEKLPYSPSGSSRNSEGVGRDLLLTSSWPRAGKPNVWAWTSAELLPVFGPAVWDSQYSEQREAVWGCDSSLMLWEPESGQRRCPVAV